MKVLRKIIEIDEELCDGCGLCVPNCAEGALQIIDGKARLVAEKYCDGLGACLGECPNGAIKIIEREAEEFDEVAVEEYLSEKEKSETKEEAPTMACGCPSTQIRTFMPSESPQHTKIPTAIQGGEGSALTHWPVKIRLVPPNAPFLKEADLLILADCVPLALPTLHKDLLQGKAVLTGCPKFDEIEEYIRKLAEIFKTAEIRSITIAIMEVPCCSGLAGIVERALEIAKKEIPIHQTVIALPK